MKKLSTVQKTNTRLKGKTLSVVITTFLFVLLFLPAHAQTGRTITGTVTSETDGEPVIGATVSEKGTTNGTITGLDGTYSITLTSPKATLVYAFVGMKNTDVPVGDKTKIDIKLSADVIGLDEVVAVGYGTMKKSDLTGSVGSVNSEDLAKVPATSLDQSLQGKASGVQITQLSAQPGGATSIRIRGANSILGGNEPLIVVDGIPIESSNDQSWISSPVVNSLGTLNPSDIESIEILKDASATSIYGSRGANGVILITTKRGQSGRNTVSFNAYYGIQKIAKRIDVMNATQYAKLYDEAGQNAATDVGDTYLPVYPDPESLGEGTDWQGEIYRTAPQMNYEFMASGGNEKTNYALSTNYFDQDGIIYGSDYKRYSGRLNLDNDVSDKLKVGGSFNYSQVRANTVGSSTPGGFFPGVVNTALTIAPTLAIRDSTGQYTLTDPNADAWLDNPVAVTRDVVAKSKTNRIIGSVYGDYDILKHLKLRVNVGIDHRSNVQDYFNPTYTYSGSFNNGQARYANFESSRFLNENTLTYDVSFGRHKLNILGGFSYQSTNTRSFIDVATGFTTNELTYYGINTAENKPTIYTGFQDELLLSWLGRVNYNYGDKLLVTLTGRADGSSKFGPDNRYAFFPSVALAYRLSQEDFIKNLGIFYNLKPRISYGISGNDKIPSYQYIPTLTNTVYYFNHTIPTTGFAPVRPGNDKLKWETTRQLDAGLDMGFFKGRIGIVADYYYKKTFDLLYPATIPSMSGFTSTILNIGTMRNKGFELTINTDNLKGKLSWKTDFNISFNKTI
ncbi:MAG TPA: TonB-dependent receptor, partial [Bacteroidales bacterium]|nr:TonB-dependent receptor [Bacteroidales bacterium]